MTTDSSSSTSRTSVRFLIKYQKYILMYVFFFISHYCTAMSFERVVHPNPLGFTFFFSHSSFYIDNMTALGVGSTLYFTLSVCIFFWVEREAFRWAQKGLSWVCAVDFFFNQTSSSHFQWSGQRPRIKTTTTPPDSRVFIILFFFSSLVLCLVITTHRFTQFPPIPCAPFIFFFFSCLWPER